MSTARRARKLPLLGVYTCIYLLVLYIPVLFLPLFSFNDSIYIAFPLKGFTLQWYQEMFTNSAMLRALENSVKLGVAVGIVSTLLGIMAAKAFTAYRVRYAGAIQGFIAIPLVIPFIILGLSLLVIFSQLGVPLSLFTIGISHVVICVPFSMLVLISRLEGFDSGLTEAAQDLGETPWMTFWLVTFPLALPGIIASFLLCFLISFDEFLLAFFLAGQESTLPVYIWTQLRFPARLPGVLALGSLILLGSVILVLIAEWFRRRGLAPTNKKVDTPFQ
jgi:spermidine/putrescine transport system permease protein